jgi:uncharacterized protein YqjF (DUF2071 family)
VIRLATAADAAELLALQRRLDAQSSYMMFEAGERDDDQSGLYESRPPRPPRVRLTDAMSRPRPPAREAAQALAAVRRQRASLARTDHRPFPLPRGPWVMGQSWIDLLFAHWAVPEAALRPAVPARIPIDTFQGSAWIAITPFEVVGAHPRAVPPLPWLSGFPELNVRTYSTIDGCPGIWFFSLDAARGAAAAAARLTYQLPYRHAEMAIARAGSRIDYRSHARSAPAVLRATYEPVGPATHPAPGTLEYFLTERYCLYTVDRHHRLRRADIHHPPWPLQPARGCLAENTMTEPLGIRLPDREPLLHYAARQDVLVWPLARVMPRLRRRET